MGDVELMRRVALKEPAAQSEVVERLQRRIYRLSLAICGDPCRAEDSLQETMISVLRHAETYRGDAPLEVWVDQIARRTAWRTQRQHLKTSHTEESLEQLGADAGWGTSESPEVLVARLKDAQLVARSIDHLSAKDREIITLRDILGYSGAEAAEQLEISLASQKSRLHRARLRLMGVIRKEGYVGQ